MSLLETDEAITETFLSTMKGFEFFCTQVSLRQKYNQF